MNYIKFIIYTMPCVLLDLISFNQWCYTS